MKRNLSEKAEDKYDEVKLKAQAKAANFAGDKGQQHKKEAQAQAKKASNHVKSSMEKQKKS